MTMTRKSELVRQHLEAAAAGAARCMAHGHRFDTTDREPVAVETTDGNHIEILCRSCAEHYGETPYCEDSSENFSKSKDSLRGEK